jgi:hypothetical protein
MAILLVARLELLPRSESFTQTALSTQTQLAYERTKYLSKVPHRPKG